MRKSYVLAIFAIFCLIFVSTSCSRTDDEVYTEIPIDPEPEPNVDVTVDLSQVPYQKLSDYHFFTGELKEQIPAEGVLPYKPSSSLFTDYAHKKRFVWMPEGSRATYNGDNKVVELPVGAVLIKTFYYDNVQNAPTPNATRIIETRIMIRKSDGWTFANYVWNNEQTEATLDMNGSNTPVEWIDERNQARTVDYRIPNESQCIVCHKSQDSNNGGTITNIPIAIKPQNLNFEYNYGNEVKNQLTKWIEYGYLEGGFTFPNMFNTVVNYEDTSQSLENRVRGYFDANCAHCHSVDRHCDYRPLRLAFHETSGDQGLLNMGVCVSTHDMQGFPSNLSTIVTPMMPENSMLFYRINTTNPTYRMPLHGRTLIHEEAVEMIQNWIYELRDCQ